ncbi:MAG: threonylcarbamoyl-AMP synthase [Immundisolibacteraceae bacterium]|nr:threonylcarbamoyl-AMP synthase [Immundisolibacteraceae bacterium]
MAKIWNVHPENPPPRVIDQAVNLLASGGVLMCPTECSYVLVHGISEKNAHERVLKIRDLPPGHLFTLMCDSVSQLSKYAHVGSAEYRILRKHCPGSFTFVLEATRLVPKNVYGPKRNTIGARISEHPVCQSLLRRYGNPVITTTARVNGSTLLEMAELNVETVFEKLVDGILFVGNGFVEETTIVDLVRNPPSVIRQGRGSTSRLGF